MSPVPTRAIRLSLAVLAALALLGGCQRAGNPIAAAIGHAARGAGDAGPAAAGDRDSLPLPPGFPDDVFLPAGYRVNSVMSLPQASVLSLSVPGDVDALLAAAEAAMREDGWTRTLSARHSADTAMLAFEKPGTAGTRNATLSFSRNVGDERVILGVQLRELRRQ
ncbi:hypothetical protein [Luteimonas wenzhouensis]|jgi:hypothetical protein|uniref:Uncharacterized protein n=1 Tax=Luteimonas wenzhouensis TaxID=2599615 RepID=A0A5C5U070_9GAMM|nr:hypothetical protein [Luteimonas wenzhouensis]NLW95671.1 hypothetical protein [Xanthomonadaceae bacterium]TWT18790.1 hypothetical protein FQY79_09075 [Luteimonas wenzhouensis]